MSKTVTTYKLVQFNGYVPMKWMQTGMDFTAHSDVYHSFLDKSNTDLGYGVNTYLREC